MSLDVDSRPARPRLRIATGPDRRIAELLRRYPEISPVEHRELSQFVRSACLLELQRLRADRTLARSVDRAIREMRDPLHRRGEILSAILLAIIFVSACWLLWSSA